MELLLKRLLIFMSLTALSFNSWGEDTTYIAIGKAKTKKTQIALPDFSAEKSVSAGTAKALETLRKDLGFLDVFEVISPSRYKDSTPNAKTGTFPLESWKEIGSDYVLKAQATSGERGLIVEAYLTEVASGSTSLAKRYVTSLGEVVSLGHTIANDVVKAITGEAGIFETKIAMVCDRTGKKEIYVMDFDGANVRQITHHRSVVLSPAWSPDGTKIAYSLISKNKKNIKNTNLYEFDFKTSSIKILSDRQGINSGVHYHPDGKQLVLTMSFLGNPEIFTLDPGSKSATRLTNSPGVDVDPNWSPDGKFISFVSSRAGASMVYKMNSDGSNVQRLTFAGTYNATPAWSPKNNKIGFAGWLDGRFDIFTMNTDGTTIERLTKSQGNNEDPAFSGDGNFLVFSSNRAGSKNIYVMGVDGNGVKRLTYGLGNCVSPRWSAPLK
jgi:TolB protein